MSRRRSSNRIPHAEIVTSEIVTMRPDPVEIHRGAIRNMVTSMFPKPEAGGITPLIVGKSMLSQARKACPNAWIETYPDD